MNRRFISFLQVVLFGLDLITLNLVVMLTAFAMIRHLPNLFSGVYVQYWVFLNITWVLVSWIGKTYHQRFIVSFETFSRRTMRVFLVWAGVIVLYLFFARLFLLSRIFITVTIVSMAIMLLVNRFIYLILGQYFRKQEYLSKKVLIIGYNEIAKKLTSYLEDESLNTQIIGYCEEDENITELSHYPILSSIADVMHTSREHHISEIFSTISPESDPGIYRLMHEADQECIRFKLIPDMRYFINRPVHIDYFRDMPVLSLRDEPLEDVSSRVKKRLLDIFVSLLVILLIMSWLVPLLSLLIWLDSRGPIFFVQTRSGRNNRPFACFKFRSMKVNKEAHTRQTTRNDERFTRIGRFLRMSNLDEFPQFFNVLMGDMSLVGPRPHMLKHTEDYSKLLGQYMVRQLLKPGITGWAQVNGFRGEIKTVDDIKQRVEHDIWYMENWSLWLDVRIMFLTIYATVIGDKNAF